MFGEAMVNSVTGCKGPQPRQNCVQLDNGNRPGIVSVIDIQNIHNDHVGFDLHCVIFYLFYNF